MSAPPEVAASPTLIAGRYRVVGELGEGGMGRVVEAVDEWSGAPVAIKLMRPELADSASAVERFRREGAALAAVSHPAVVSVREVGELEDGGLYLAMERLEGESLSTHLQREGRLSAVALAPLLHAIASGLAAAHAVGVIHRDVKPSNVHLEPNGESPAKLVDFGVARVGGLERLTSTGLAVGTVRYMAPEQLSGAAIDERVDQYALGVIAYEALAGEHPMERTGGADPIGAILVGRVTPLSTLRPDLPPALIRCVHRAIARITVERFASVTEFAHAFAQAAEGADETLGPSPMRAVQNPVATPEAFAATAIAPSHAPLSNAPPSGAPLSGAPPSGAPPSGSPRSSAPLPNTPGASATTVPPTRSVVRPTSKPLRRPPRWLLAPLLFGLLGVPLLGGVFFVGCNDYMADLQVRGVVRTVRGTVADHPVELAEYAGDLDTLERMNEEGRVGVLGAAAVNAHVQHALRGDERVDLAEANRIFAVIREVIEKESEFSMDDYRAATADISG